MDGLLTASMSIRDSALTLADYLNMYPKYVDNTTGGGGSFEFHLSHALNAIASGRINCAVITYSTLARSGGISVGIGGSERSGPSSLNPSPDSFEELYGLTTVGLYALIAQRHMHLYGTTSEQLAEISVVVRKHASMNPEALFRNPITVDDVVNSRVISSPLHLLDCCVITDGGGAVVVASPEGRSQLQAQAHLGPRDRRSSSPSRSWQTGPDTHRRQTEHRARIRYGRGDP